MQSIAHPVWRNFRLISHVFAGLAMLAGMTQTARAVNFLTEENPPYNFTRDKKVVGLSTEIVTEAAKRAGLTVQIESIAWDDAYRRGQVEKETCLYSVARLENRENLFQWVGELAQNKWAVFGRQEFSRIIKSTADLRPLKIGGVATDAKVEFLRSSAVTNIREVVRDEQNPPRLFLKPDDPNYIDLWVTGYYSAATVAAGAKAGPIKFVYMVREQPLWLACSSRTEKDTVKKLSDALASMKKDGTHKRLVDVIEKSATR